MLNMKKNSILFFLMMALSIHAQFRMNDGHSNLSQPDFTISSAGDDILRVIPLSENRYQISLSSRSDGKDKMVCIKVYDVKNLQTKIHDNFEKEDYIFETFSWKRGFYIIEITMGKKKYTTKLSVR